MDKMEENRMSKVYEKMINLKHIRYFIGLILLWSIIGLINFYNILFLRISYILFGSLSISYLISDYKNKNKNEMTSEGKKRALVILLILSGVITIIHLSSLHF